MKKKKTEWKPKKPKSLLEKIIIIATILGGIAAIGYFVDKVFFPPAPKELVKEVKELKEKVGQMAEYLDGLPETKNPELKRLFEKGYALYRSEKYLAAIDTFKVSLQQRTTDSERMALLILIGIACHRVGKLKEAEEHYQEALLIEERMSNGGDEKGKASALGNLGLIYQDKGDLDQGLKYFEKALKIYQKIGFREGEVSVLCDIGGIYKERRDVENALRYQQAALTIAKETDFKQGEATALGNIGVIYQIVGELDSAFLDSALKYQYEALAINREEKLREGEANTLGNIGVVYRAKGELDHALKYFKNALEIFRGMPLKEGEATALGNIGVVYQDQYQLDSALKYHQEALDINRQIDRREGEANQLGNIGNVYYLKGDLNQSLKYLNEALEIFEEIGMQWEIGIVKRNIQRIKEMTNDE